MPPNKPPKRLTEWSLLNVGDFLANYASGVAKTSFSMIESLNSSSSCIESNNDWTTPDFRYHRGFQQDHERKAFTFVDDSIVRLRESFFSSIPWYCHQSLVEQVLKVLSKTTHSASATYRKTAGGPNADWNRHLVFVIVRFVKVNVILS